MSKLKNFGIEMINKYELKNKRIIFNFETSNYIDICEKIINKKIIKYKMINRVFNNNTNLKELKYHIDDCQLVTLKQTPIFNQNKYIKITSNKYLFINNEMNQIPLFTVIFYLSDYNIDFSGGIFIFADGTKIYPQKNLGILFDGREVHMVTPITHGSRKSTIIKIYEIIK